MPTGNQNGQGGPGLDCCGQLARALADDAEAEIAPDILQPALLLIASHSGAQPDSPSAELIRSARQLAVVAMTREGRPLERLPPDEYEKLLERSFPFYLLLRCVQAIVPRMTLPGEPGADHQLALACQLAVEFEQAAAPRKLANLVRESGFRRRVAAWLRKRFWRGSEVHSHAERLLERSRPLTTAAMHALLNRTPLPRLRTYSNHALRRIARNYAAARWFFCPASDEDGARKASEEFKKARETVLRSLRGFRREKAEDALMRAFGLASDPVHGYTGEGDFIGYLTAVAGRLLYTPRRTALPVEPLDPDTVAARPKPSNDRAQLVQLQVRTELLFTLADTAAMETRYRELWTLDRLNAEEMGDEFVAKLLAMRTGAIIEVATLAQTRRRMHRRWWVIEFAVASAQRNGAVMDEDTLWQHLRTKFGQSRDDLKTLRLVLMLVRAAMADLDAGLTWATLSRCIVDRSQTVDSASRCVNPFLYDPDAAAYVGVDCHKAQTRLKAIRRWLRRHGTLLGHLRGEARENSICCFLAALFTLIVVQGKPVEDAVAILRPTADEERHVRALAEQLYAARLA